jgi:hypothetical protein
MPEDIGSGSSLGRLCDFIAKIILTFCIFYQWILYLIRYLDISVALSNNVKRIVRPLHLPRLRFH